jgi:hypothetical protein
MPVNSALGCFTDITDFIPVNNALGCFTNITDFIPVHSALGCFTGSVLVAAVGQADMLFKRKRM